MKFSHVAQVFEEIEKTSGRLDMTKLLADLLKKANPEEAGIIANFSLGTLRPSYLGMQFNFAEKSMFSVVAQLLEESESVITNKTKECGDLGLVVQDGVWKPTTELTITQVYQALCNFEEISGVGSQEEKSKNLLILLQKLDPLSAKYVVRIILGTLRLGFSDMTFVDALSWMEVGNKSLRTTIEDAYNICADIGHITTLLKESGIKAIEKMHIKIGVPIRPAAAERLPTPDAIIEKLGDCVAQPKLDGFRLQIHIDNSGKKPKIYFFSRNLIDMSHMFPDLVAAFKDVAIEQLICEGEAIVYDPSTGSFLPFQETVKRKRKHGIEEAVSEYPLKVYLFDLLYANGKDYMTETHEARRMALIKIFKGVKDDVINIIDEKEIQTSAELERYFVDNIAHGLEGLVVKKPNSIYQPGKRNFNWIKLKRHEEGHLEDTLDCTILGYYAGSGKRAGFGVGAFLVGIFNPEKDHFQTVAKIGTGLTDEEWVELKKKCDAIALKTKPKNIECAKELTPDVWVDPELVCSIRADEITLSPLHTAGKTEHQLGFALRFPRFMGYRTDKTAQQSTTVEELQHLFHDQFQKPKKKR